MFCRSRLCLSISLACTALAGVPVYAEEAVELEAVTISATRAKSEAGKTPQKITVITREQIEQQLAITSDHGQILSNLIPSYSPSRQKMSSAGETFRGRSALVLIDGVPQSTPLRNSARDGYTIDMAMVERIEVIRGPASTLYGADALGGVINIITKADLQGLYLTAEHTAPQGGVAQGKQFSLSWGQGKMQRDAFDQWVKVLRMLGIVVRLVDPLRQQLQS